MNVYLFAAVVVTGVAGASLGSGHDTRTDNTNPCRYSLSGGSGDLSPHSGNWGTASRRELVNDFLTSLIEGRRETIRIMKIYRRNTPSRLSRAMRRHRIQRLNASPGMTSSIFKAYDTNLQHDYTVLSMAMLYLEQFEEANPIVGDLMRKITFLQCRISELLMNEGGELSPLPSVTSLYGRSRDNAAILINEYQMLMDIEAFLTNSITLYRTYSRNI